MAAVDIFDVRVLDNPAPFTNPLQFEITYDVREALKEDIEWQVLYVGSAEDQSLDQELDAVLLPADNTGRFKFVLQVPAPDPNSIPPADILGVTIVLLTCSYKEQEFIRVGYYVNNESPDHVPVAEEAQADELTAADDGVADGEDGENEDADVDAEDVDMEGGPESAAPGVPGPGPSRPPPQPSSTRITTMPDISKITRIISSEPTVTRFPSKWDAQEGTMMDPELSGDAHRMMASAGAATPPVQSR